MLCLHYTQGIVGSTVARCHNAIFTQAARTNETLCALCFRERPINRVIKYKDCESPISLTSLLSLRFISFLSLSLSRCWEISVLILLVRTDCAGAPVYVYFFCLYIYALRQVYLNFFYMRPTSKFAPPQYPIIGSLFIFFWSKYSKESSIFDSSSVSVKYVLV